MVDAHAGTRFAAALDAAIKARGLSLNEIAGAMRQAGFSMTPATLSYWRHGRVQPRRRNSMAVLGPLEESLGLPPGTLTDALEADAAEGREAARRQLQGREPVSMMAPSSDVQISRNFNAVDERTDWNTEVVREVLEEEVVVSEDFRTLSVRVTQIVRVGNTPGTLQVSAFWEKGHEPDPDDIGVYNVLGADVGETVVEEVPEGIAKTTTLKLPSILARGEVHHVRYEHRFTSSTPAPFAIHRAFSWPIKYYMARVMFAGEVPQNIRWTLSTTLERDDSLEKTTFTRPLEVRDKTVLVTAEQVANAVGTLQWNELPPGNGGIIWGGAAGSLGGGSPVGSFAGWPLVA